MKEFGDAKFLIAGHTDSQGATSYNQKLSEQRAAAVVTYLVGKGIAADRLSSVGFGEDQPIATNKTRAGRAQNRRVEINLKK
jgi:outer membrane protein OmpA-like peptidoglycan-associated protein